MIVSGDAISQHLLSLFDNYIIGCLRKTVNPIYFVCLLEGHRRSFLAFFNDTGSYILASNEKW
jgi:hypothetical protein